MHENIARNVCECITWILNKADLSEGYPVNYIEGLSYKCYPMMPNKLYRRVVQQILSEACPIDLFSENCPMNFNIGDCTLSVQKQKNILFWKQIFIHGKCICEGVGKDSRHGARHVDIRVRMCIFLLECVRIFHCMCT